jgi:MraZ protein
VNLFLSTYINNIDKKNRISVPASFRAALNGESFAGIIAYPSIKNQCIEACGLKRIEELSQIIENLDPYSPERDAFETIILGGSTQLSFDSEGRVVLAKELIDYAAIDGQACFVGKGQVFEIWNPEVFNKHSEKAKDIAFNNKLLLKNLGANSLAPTRSGDK